MTQTGLPGRAGGEVADKAHDANMATLPFRVQGFAKANLTP